jgi:hypothetical protein
MAMGHPRVGPALIDEAPSVNGLTFNPVTLIRAVNGLWRLGHAGAVATLREYIAAKSASMTIPGDYGLTGERVVLVTRLLFVPNDERYTGPPIRMGLPDFAPLDQANWGLFPLALSQDIPFLLVGGYSLGGLPDNPTSHIDFWEQHGRLQSEPLSPQASPVEAVSDVLSALQRANSATVESVRGRLYAQALRAVRPLYDTPEAEIEALASGESHAIAPLWERHAKAIVELSPRWIGEKQEFVAGAKGVE